MNDTLSFVILLLGLAYIQYLEDSDCRERGGTVVKGFLSNSCEATK